MDTGNSVSVIIPTYNRKEYLHDTLDSLARQTWPSNQFEVVIVDDGSTDGTEDIVKNSFPFTLRYIHQPNQGDAIARNTGVNLSQADMLVFLDDDMLVGPNYLTLLLTAHESPQRRIIVGTEYLWLNDGDPITDSTQAPQGMSKDQPLVEHPFTFVFSRNMSIRRDDYIDLGMMDNLGFSGSSIWCDVDFAYRAYQQGFQFLRSTRAICYHRDHTARDLVNTKQRNWEAAYRAVTLFQKYPGLLPYLPMFHDKIGINWRQDSWRLVARKILRKIASTKLILISFESIIKFLERRNSSSFWLNPLYRWIIGGYIYNGFREGIRKFGPVQLY